MANTLPSSFIALIVPGSGDIANGIGRTNQGYPRGGFDSRGPQWGPRFGFAYDPFGYGRSVVRGGFGITYDRSGTNIHIWNCRQTRQRFCGRRCPSAGCRNLPPAAPHWLRRTSRVCNGRPCPHRLQLQPGRAARTWIQHGPGRGIRRNLSRHLMQSRNLNAIPYGTTFTREAQDPALYPGGVVPDTEPNLQEAYRQAGLRFSGANAKRVEFLRPYRGYGNIIYREPVGSANYHSLQMSLDRRFAQGLQFNVSYTWSKTLATANGDQELTHPFDTRRHDYRLASFDRPHAFSASFVYQAPKLGRYIGNHWLARAVLDNWQVSGITSVSSGAPLELAASIVGVNGIESQAHIPNLRVCICAVSRSPARMDL